MHDVFVARQPIFDRSLKVFGYELLFRHADSNEAHVEDGDIATSELILNAFTAIDFDELVGTHRAFINMTRSFLLRERQVALPADRVVLEVLEDSQPDPALIDALQNWKRCGYQIALDDFILQESLLPLVAVADIAKVEINTATPAQITEQVQALRRHKLHLLAEKVETQEQFEFCHELGFDYLQGFFLQRPKVVRGTSIPTGRMPTVMLLAALHRPDIDVDELEEIIGRNVSLSYKLLRYLNSPLFPLKRRIESIRQALVYIGLQELRVWASLVTLSAVPGKPHALVTMLMVRAKTCELLAKELEFSNTGNYFTVGLFSGLDALLDAPLAEILESIGLGEEMTAALLERKGESGRILEAVLDYEQGAWDGIDRSHIPGRLLSEAYLGALRWARQAALAA